MKASSGPRTPDVGPAGDARPDRPAPPVSRSRAAGRPTSPDKEAEARQLQEAAGKAAAMLRAVGNERRLMVLCLLIQEGEMPVGALAEQVGLSQSALSQHLARMREEGLVTFRREAQSLYYRIGNPDVEKLVDTLKAIFCP